MFRSLSRHERQMADLSALADDSITPARRALIEQQIEESNDLRRLLERERTVVELCRDARERDRAPGHLRSRIAAQRAAADRRPGRGRTPFLGGAVAATATAGAIAALVLVAGGGSVGPSVAQAATLAFRGATAAAPAPDPTHHRALGQGVGDVYFPNWSDTIGWEATGQRSDRLDAHRAITVYYERHGQQVAYTILSVPALPAPTTRPQLVDGVRLRALAVRGRAVVTWQRNGRTCVLSSPDVPVSQLERLAAWQPNTERS